MPEEEKKHDLVDFGEEEGAEIVWVSCPDEASSYALKEITKSVNLTIVADIHILY